MRKIHPRWKRVRLGQKKELKRIKIDAADCEACKKRCRRCKLPFTVSTADDEQTYCSRRCEGQS